VLDQTAVCLRQLQRLQVKFPGQLNTELPMLMALCQKVLQGEMPYLPALAHAVQTRKRITHGTSPEDPLIVGPPVWGWVESYIDGLKNFLMSNECWEAWAWNFPSKPPLAELLSKAYRSPVVQELAGQDRQSSNISLMDATYPSVGFRKWKRPGPPNPEQK